MKYTFVITALLLLLLANVLMVSRSRSAYASMEGFQAMNNMGIPVASTTNMANSSDMEMEPAPEPEMPMTTTGAPVTEGFASYFLEESAGTGKAYSAMGAYDGVQLSTGNSSSVWRYTAPNEKLLGQEFVPGDDSLFMFKNNQCKPECCGSSFSCGGGCVCTTPKQRQYLAGRAGNRTKPEDSA
jgi:hypothetical protein